MKHTNRIFMDESFTYHVTGYDSRKREYILQNVVTKEEKRIPKKDVEDMMKEQHRSQKQ